MPLDFSPELIQAITDSIKALIPEPYDSDNQLATYAAIWLLAEQQDDPHAPPPGASVPEAPVLTNPEYWTCDCKTNFVHYKTFSGYCPHCEAWKKDRSDSLIVVCGVR